MHKHAKQIADMAPDFTGLKNKEIKNEKNTNRQPLRARGKKFSLLGTDVRGTR